MNVSVRYFAALKERAGVEQESLRSAPDKNAAQLFAELAQRHGFAFAQQDLRVAINGRFAQWDTLLQEGDELAFLPPFSGG